MKNNKVKELLDKRKIGHTAKDTKIGETIYQCVLFKHMAKITETPNVIIIEYPLTESKTRILKNISEFELYLNNGRL
jgi:hypothetical protein